MHSYSENNRISLNLVSKVCCLVEKTLPRHPTIRRTGNFPMLKLSDVNVLDSRQERNTTETNTSSTQVLSYTVGCWHSLIEHYKFKVFIPTQITVDCSERSALRSHVSCLLACSCH